MFEEGNVSRQIRHEHELELPSSTVSYVDCRSGGMELEEVTSGLLALRKLYGLLQTSEDGELDAIAVQLDASAQALLKDLLDQASERLLERYSQIITDRLGTRLASSASISWQSVEDSKQITRNSNLDIPNIRSDSGFEGTVTNTDATPTAEGSTRLLGVSSSRPGISGKSSSACVHSSMTQQVSSVEAKRRPMTDSKVTQDNHLCKSSVLVRGSRQPPRREKVAQPTNYTFAEAESSNVEISPNSDLSNAIKRIEAQILVLQHLSGLGSPLESAGWQAKDRETKIPGWVGNRITRSPSSIWSPLKENSESTTAMVGLSNVWAPNARISSRTSNVAHEFHVPESLAESEMSHGLTVDKESVRKVVQPRLLVPSQDAVQSVTSVSSRNRMSTRRNLKLAYQMESEESSSGSQDSSSYGSSSRSSQMTSSSTGFPSEYYSRSYTDYTDFSQGSRGESEDSSSFSSYSVPSLHKPMEPSLRKVSPTARRSRSPNPGRAVGKLRKIKNKLGLIFHHHHHHHHHHHNENEEDGVHKSKWKSVGDNILRVPNKNQFNGGRKIIDKSKKSVDKTGQGGHFHTLVEGLLRHIRHSKKKKKKVRLPDPNGAKSNARKKKLHWWQMMRRRGGAKLPKGGRQPKLKLPDKRAQLGAAKG